MSTDQGPTDCQDGGCGKYPDCSCGHSTLPDWAIRPEARQTFENTYRVSRQSLPVLMGLDAMRLCMGKEPATFTRAGVLHWMDVVKSDQPDDKGCGE
jgi:hypothetical protein